MFDEAWKKYIIKVECSPEKQSDAYSSTIFFCRKCSFFRSTLKEGADLHLSQVHRMHELEEPCGENLITSKHEESLCDSHQTVKNEDVSWTVNNNTSSQTVISTTDLSYSTSPRTIDTSLSDSPLAPSSPLSPIIKRELGSERKRIVISVSTSPVPTNTVIDSLPTTAAASELFDCDQLGNQPQLIFYCAHCNHRFLRQKALDKHVCRQHQQPCEKSNTPPVSTMKVGQFQPGCVSTFGCQFCNRVFDSKQACDIHTRRHNIQKNVYCPLCGVGFVQMASLKRHTFTVHGIVPESSYLDNPNDKDFDVSQEIDSGSDGGSDNSSSTLKKSRANKRRHPRSRNGRSRGRAKRSLDWVLDSSKIKPIHSPLPLKDPTPPKCEELIPNDQRYRTILPRPNQSSVTASSTAFEPLGIGKARRWQRSKRTTPRGSSRSSHLSPMLCDTLASGQHCVLPTDHTVQIHDLQEIQSPGQPAVIYLDSTSLLSNFISPTDSQQYGHHSSDEARPTHVLTVAAAYASQLPASVCTSEDQPAALLQDQAPNLDTIDQTVPPSITIPSGTVVPGIQIYPTPWLQSSEQLGSNWTSNGEPPNHSATDTPSGDLGRTDSNNSPLEPHQSFQIPQSAIQLYPVLSADGQTIAYYMAAPADALDISEITNETPSDTQLQTCTDTIQTVVSEEPACIDQTVPSSSGDLAHPHPTSSQLDDVTQADEKSIDTFSDVINHNVHSLPSLRMALTVESSSHIPNYNDGFTDATSLNVTDYRSPSRDRVDITEADTVEVIDLDASHANRGMECQIRSSTSIESSDMSLPTMTFEKHLKSHESASLTVVPVSPPAQVPSIAGISTATTTLSHEFPVTNVKPNSYDHSATASGVQVVFASNQTPILSYIDTEYLSHGGFDINNYTDSNNADCSEIIEIVDLNQPQSFSHPEVAISNSPVDATIPPPTSVSQHSYSVVTCPVNVPFPITLPHHMTESPAVNRNPSSTDQCDSPVSSTSEENVNHSSNAAVHLISTTAPSSYAYHTASLVEPHCIELAAYQSEAIQVVDLNVPHSILQPANKSHHLSTANDAPEDSSVHSPLTVDDVWEKLLNIQSSEADRVDSHDLV